MMRSFSIGRKVARLTTRTMSSTIQTHQRSVVPTNKKVLRATLAFTAIGTTAATYTTMRYLDMSFDDVLVSLRLRSDKLTEKEERELEQLTEVKPIEIPKVLVEHPYKERSFLWRCLFTIRRGCYLISLFVPVCVYGAYFKMMKYDDEVVRKKWILMVVNAMERGGCTLLKFGQWISMRPDMFPRDLCEMCANLRQNAPTHEFHLTRDMIRESFGMEVEEIFEHIDRMPVASGCVGQVYRARLREEFVLANGDRDVAVKIRHPSVLEETYIDFDFLFECLIPTMNIVGRWTGTKVSMPFVRDNFYNLLMRQIDFRFEA